MFSESHLIWLRSSANIVKFVESISAAFVSTDVEIGFEQVIHVDDKFTFRFNIVQQCCSNASAFC